MTEPLSARAHAAAVLMHQAGGDPGRRPELADYRHLDTAPDPAPAQEPPAPAPPPAPVSWDLAAFDQLPDEVRAGVRAGVAHHFGRAMLEVEAVAELGRPADVHLYLADPGRYVDANGTVNHDAIRADLAGLVRDRPELSRYGNRPDQERNRPDTRRKSPGGTPAGAVREPANGLAARVAAAAAAMNAGL